MLQIEEVNEYLTEANDKASKDNEEKFSKFLISLTVPMVLLKSRESSL